MPIAKFKATRPRFSRLGKLRKGAEKGSNRPGEDLNYFRMDAERPAVQAAFKAAYGKEPASLSIYLPHPTVDENFSTWQEEWAGGGLVHRCDGELLYDYRGENGAMMHDDPPTLPCPYESGDQKRTRSNPGCKAIGRLELVLPELLKRGHVGTVTFETHSLNDIGNILGALKATAEARGADPQGLRGIEFSLYRQPEEISMWDEKLQKHVRREKWLCRIAPAASWVQMQLALASAQAMGGEINERLTLPGPEEAPEPPATRTESAPAASKPAEEPPPAKRGRKPGKTEPRVADEILPPEGKGRSLTHHAKAFGSPILTAGIETDTYGELMNLSKSYDKMLGPGSVQRELESVCPGAFVIHNGERKYTRLALTEAEGKVLIKRLKNVASTTQRGGEDQQDPGPPPDDDIPDFDDDARE